MTSRFLAACAVVGLVMGAVGLFARANGGARGLGERWVATPGHPWSHRAKLVPLPPLDFRRAASRVSPEQALPSSPPLRLETLGGEPLLEVVAFEDDGTPIDAAFRRIRRALRARSGHEVDIHPRLVELLITLSLAFDGRPLALVSGHREPGRGTKKTSYHVRGMAADVTIRGVNVHDLREAAVRLGARGVGVYPTFVHVDVRPDRPPYRWVGGARIAWARARVRKARAQARRRHRKRLAARRRR
ncbi:MAG: DUF882 domain-containing protein [Myxococcota bacterium]